MLAEAQQQVDAVVRQSRQKAGGSAAAQEVQELQQLVQVRGGPGADWG
jgi:hypothetical protein